MLLFNSEHLIFSWHVLVGSGFALQPLINFRVLSGRAGSTGRAEEISVREPGCAGPAGGPSSLCSPLLPPPRPGRAHRWLSGTAIICLCWLPGPGFGAGLWRCEGRTSPCPAAIAAQSAAGLEPERPGLTPSCPGRAAGEVQADGECENPPRSTDNCEDLVEQSFSFFFLSPSPKLAGLKGIFGKRCEAPLDDPGPSRNSRRLQRL